MDQFLDVLRGIGALLVALAVVAAIAQVALGNTVASLTADFHLPIVLLFVVLMAVVLVREVWTVLAAHR